MLEVLLAVAVFAIVLVAIHGVFYGALRLRNQTTKRMDAAVALQQTLAILKRDLANLAVPGGTLSGTLQTTPTSGSLTDPSRLGLSSAMNDERGTPVSPDFYTTVGMVNDTLPWGEIERVSYFLATPTNNLPGRELFRSVTRNLLPTLSEEPEDQWLMSGVEDVWFSYYDGMEWRDWWDSTTESTPLPAAVKVQLWLASAEPGAVPRPPIELVVPLLAQGSTNTTSATASETQP